MNFRMEIDAQANSHVRKAKILLLDEDGNFLGTACGNLYDLKEQKKVVKDLVEQAPSIGAEKIINRLKEAWQETLKRHRAEQEAQEARAAATAKKSDPAEADPEADSLRLLAEMPSDIREEAQALLRDPDLIDRVSDDIELQGVAGEKELTTTLYLVFTSRKLCRPLAARVRGPSTSGKSHAVDRTVLLMPRETTIHATQMTPQALFYMPKGSLRHKLIVGGERSRANEEETAEATRALREMLTAGRLSKLLPLKIGDRMETVLIEQEGPVAFVETTTLGTVFDEDENRALPLCTDERPEQTRRILTATGKVYEGQVTGNRDPGRVQQVHHAAQRMLERREVVIPFATCIASKLPDDRVEVRRAFPALMSMIQASALLHQFQRQYTPEGRILATQDDYRVAAIFIASAMRRMVGGGISEPATRFGERLKTWFDDKTLTLPLATKKEKNCPRSVYGWVKELREAGVVERVSEAAGRTAATYRLTDLDPNKASYVLPALGEIFKQ
jgi:hypothetical protein